MPPPEAILTGLTTLANDWRWLAIIWHVVLAVLLLAFASGWRPPTRLIRYLLVAPLLSVSLLAWLSGNPFNGAVFGMLAAALAITASRGSNRSIRCGSPVSVASGIALIVFGWTYPHFLRADSWTTYLYASPFGLVPCPTLSVVIGITLLFRDLWVGSWSVALVVAGFLYGAIGVFWLGVALDWGLLCGSAMLAVAAARATNAENVSWPPGF